MSVLAVRALSKAFGGVHAVDDVSFDIGSGEFLAMIGPNGAGKSTCFNMINGQLAPDCRRYRVARARPSRAWRRATSGGLASGARSRSRRRSVR